MIVRTPERRFVVIQVLRSDEEAEICVCRDPEDESASLYTLARLRSPALRRTLLPLLVRQQDNPSFEDYLGVFSQDGDVYARFRYTDAPLLVQRLERGGFGFRERLEMGGNLLERITLLDMPPALQFQALRDGNVTVDDALRVRFNYTLDSADSCRSADMGLIALRVGELLEKLFAAERAAKSVPELEEYLKQLEQGAFPSYLAMYAGYDQVRKALLARTLSGPVQPRTWLFRLWERIKKLRVYVRPVLAGLVLVAAFCYLVYTLLLPAQPKGTPVLFDSIGTVEIQTETAAPHGDAGAQ